MNNNNEWGFYTLPTQADPEQRAITRLKIASEMALTNYGTPLVITSSGGKDSSAIVELAIRAGIPFEVMHSHTTADAPETVRFVRAEFRRLEELGIKCTIIYPTYKGKRTSMWDLMQRKLRPPTRTVRYCCDVLKEHGADGRFVATGVRWSESFKRANFRGIFEKQVYDSNRAVKTKSDADSLEALFAPCKLKAKHIVNPIVDWRDSDPAYKKLYLQTFAGILRARRDMGRSTSWQTAEEVFSWWMEENVLPGQMTLEDFA